MNELIGVGLMRIVSAEFFLGCTTVDAAPIMPSVSNALEADVALSVIEVNNRVPAVRLFGTVQAAS